MSSDLELPLPAAEFGEVVRAYQAAVDDFDREVARLLGVNETDLRCLEILLQDVPEAAPGLLASRLGLSSGAVTSMLDRLERAGFILRSAHPTDRRRTIVRATAEAAKRAGALLSPLVTQAGQQLLSRYTAKELRLLVDFMRWSGELRQRHAQRLREIAESSAAQAES